MNQKIITLSRMSSIALCSMCIITAASGRPISAKEIAKLINCSEYHLVKVLQKLSRGGFIASTRGPNGGFALMQAAESISLLDIYCWMEEDSPKRLDPITEPSLSQSLSSALYQDKCAELEADFRAYLASRHIGEYTSFVEAETKSLFQRAT